MICKERNPLEHPESDKFSKAGAKAEVQMAFYLRRAFVDSPDVLVFNDLRYKMEDDDRAQIDHLILHKYGFIIIESKSVTTKVSINERGEWVRYWNSKPDGMPSPILQAECQIAFLKRGLNIYCEELVGKVFGFLQALFSNCPFDIIIAISDQGIIERGGNELPEVIKADQVSNRVKDVIKREKRRHGPLYVNFKDTDGLYKFKAEEMAAIKDWLLDHHYPLHEAPKSTQAAPAAEPQREAPPPPEAEEEHCTGLGICNKCGAQCEILWGRYGYYWKCAACAANMPIKLPCPSCNRKMKLRKDKKRFFKYCEPCESPEDLYCEFE